MRLACRTGVNTGEVVASTRAETCILIGDAVNVAARLEQAARAGEILIGEQTQRLVRHDVTSSLSAAGAQGQGRTRSAYRCWCAGRTAKTAFRPRSSGATRSSPRSTRPTAKCARAKRCAWSPWWATPAWASRAWCTRWLNALPAARACCADAACPTVTASRSGRSWKCSAKPPTSGPTTRPRSRRPRCWASPATPTSRRGSHPPSG